MRFFKRDQQQREAGGDFWSWWPGARDRIAGAISGGGFDDRLIGEINRAVQGIHPSMAWELAPGRTAQHAFCISPEGNPELRQVALRWLALAPAPDATWEYHAAKQAASALMGLEVAGRRFDLEAMRATSSWDPARQRVDVRLWHPGFEGLPEQIRLQVGFLFLDQLLGEEDVERWIGSIDLLDAPTGGRTPTELKAEVERRRVEAATATDGDGTWVLGERTGPDGQPEIVMADAALKRIDHPFANHHVSIAVHFGVERFPTDTEAALLNAEEDDLVTRLGDTAIFAARTTSPGVRTLHFVAPEPDAMRASIDPWAEAMPDSLSEGLPQRRIKIDFQHDMAWDFQRELGVR